MSSPFWYNTNIEFQPHPEHPRFCDLTGKTFGRLTALGYMGRHKNTFFSLWLCRCECGNRTTVLAGNLKKGNTTSCGCFGRLRSKQRRLVHGESESGGHSETPEYRSYRSARDRCNNPNAPMYQYYGGRGIEFRFESFAEFLVNIGRKPGPKYTLDRKKVDGHYEPGNIRWATALTQSRNRRNIILVSVGNVTRPLYEWAELNDLRPATIRGRLQAGWCGPCSVTIPTKTPLIRHEPICKHQADTHISV